MPLTAKGKKIKSAMQEQYGSKKGTSVFYASINKGKVTGAEKGGGKIMAGENTDKRASQAVAMRKTKAEATMMDKRGASAGAQTPGKTFYGGKVMGGGENSSQQLHPAHAGYYYGGYPHFTGAAQSVAPTASVKAVGGTTGGKGMGGGHPMSHALQHGSGRWK